MHFYNKRGTAEQWINESKQATHWTRLSGHRYQANEAPPWSVVSLPGRPHLKNSASALDYAHGPELAL